MCIIDKAYFLLRVSEQDLIKLTNKEGGKYDSDVMTAVIDDASSIVDNVIYDKFGYPLSLTSDYSGENAKKFIKKLKFDIALYFLYKRKLPDEEMKDVYVNYNKAFSMVEKIRKGELGISGIVINNSSVALISTNLTSDDQIFTTDRLATHI